VPIAINADANEFVPLDKDLVLVKNQNTLNAYGKKEQFQNWGNVKG